MGDRCLDRGSCENGRLARRGLYVVDPWGSGAGSNSGAGCVVKHLHCLSLFRAAAQSAAVLSRYHVAVAVDGIGDSLQLCARVAVAMDLLFEVVTVTACEFGCLLSRAALPSSLSSLSLVEWCVA